MDIENIIGHFMENKTMVDIIILSEFIDKFEEDHHKCLLNQVKNHFVMEETGKSLHKSIVGLEDRNRHKHYFMPYSYTFKGDNVQEVEFTFYEFNWDYADDSSKIISFELYKKEYLKYPRFIKEMRKSMYSRYLPFEVVLDNELYKGLHETLTQMIELKDVLNIGE